MRKSSKGALAASAAALLLLGGLGTHATWSSGSTLQGGKINTGALSLSSTCDTNWVYGVLDKTGTFVKDRSVASADLGSLFLIPGDVLQKTCSFTVHVEGTHLVEANLTVTQPTIKDATTGQALGSLATDATFEDAQDTVLGATTKVKEGDVITAVLTVQLPRTLDGLSGQGLKGALDDVTVEISQPQP